MEGGKFYRGVFWVVDGALLAYPFIDGVYGGGVARSGVTYNHKKLWEQLHGSRGKPYNYYPRGRVDADNKGQPVIYMSPAYRCPCCWKYRRPLPSRQSRCSDTITAAITDVIWMTAGVVKGRGVLFYWEVCDIMYESVWGTSGIIGEMPKI